MLKSTPHYLKKSLLFYDLKSRYLPAVVFVFLLITNAIYSLFDLDLPSIYYDPNTIFDLIARNVAVMTCYMLVSEVFSFVYQIGAIRDIKGEAYSTGGCFLVMLTRLFIFLVTLIIKLLIVFAGIVLFVVPGIIALFVFYFVEILVVEQKMPIVKAFKVSRKIMIGKKLQIFTLELSCMIIILVLGATTTMLFSGFNDIVFTYVNAFISAITSLTTAKRAAHIYTDVFYGDKEQTGAQT